MDAGPDEARFAEPNGLCLVPDELRMPMGYDVVVADTANHVLRGVRLADGEVVTVAGTGEQFVVGGQQNVAPGPGGEPWVDGPDGMDYASDPLHIRLSSPWDVVWSQDLAGFVVAMAGTHSIWAFDDHERSMRRIAGTMNEGLVDGEGRGAWFAQTSGPAVGPGGRIWLADPEVSALRWLVPARGEVTVHTAVGRGLFDFGHRDGPADAALLQHPLGVAVLPDGSVAIADTYNGAIRRYDPVTDTVTTLVRDLAEPSGLLVDAHDDAHAGPARGRVRRAPDHPGPARRAPGRGDPRRGRAPHRPPRDRDRAGRAAPGGRVHPGARPEARHPVRPVDPAPGQRLAGRTAAGRRGRRH